jgi:hypothetical protein
MSGPVQEHRYEWPVPAAFHAKCRFTKDSFMKLQCDASETKSSGRMTLIQKHRLAVTGTLLNLSLMVIGTLSAPTPLVSQSSNEWSFLVVHQHIGFPGHYVDGVVTLSSGRVAFAERGNHSNPDDNFAVPCKDVIDLDENATGNAMDRHHILFHIKLRNKNYNFQIEKTDYKELKIAFLTKACRP